MKKIITLLLCTGVFVSTFAQTSSEESRRIILGRKSGGSTSGTGSRTSDPRDVILGRDDRRADDNGRYPSGTYGSREEQINQVNREYDYKIQSIRNNPSLSEAEKERMIRQLNADRARRIRELNARTQDRNDRDRRYDRDDRDDDDDDDYKKDKKYKSNNGNHYGWEKGKGNPHRNGGQPGKGHSGKGNHGKGNGKGRS